MQVEHRSNVVEVTVEAEVEGCLAGDPGRIAQEYAPRQILDEDIVR
jgi:hypothetical protein